MTGKLKAMSKAKKVLLGVGAFTVLAGIIGANSPDSSKQLNIQNSSSHAAAQQEPDNDTAKKKVEPKIEKKTVEEAAVIPFTSMTQNDSSLASGKTVVSVTGVNGEKITTFEVTYTDGKETGRTQTSERVSVPAVNQITKIGTKVAVAPKPVATSSSCDPNYSGACVPIASDVDCKPGSGNGPAYVYSRVTVIGTDIYGLDADNDGIGCDNS
jgi:hypothetical protein